MDFKLLLKVFYTLVFVTTISVFIHYNQFRNIFGYINTKTIDNYIKTDTIKKDYIESDNLLNNDSLIFAKRNRTKSYNKTNTKIIRFECIKIPCGGWADRLKGIVDAYAWSILTGRSLEINIQHPCLLYHLFDTNDIDWYKTDQEMDDEKYVKRRTHFILYKFMDSDLQSSMETLDLINYAEEADIIVLSTNLDWLNNLSKNEKLKNRIIELGYSPSKFRTPYMFRTIYNQLFRLQPFLESKYNEFLKMAKPSTNTKLICIQYRVVYAERNNTNRFFQFAKTTFIDTLRADEDYKVFITTDEKYVEKEAINFFGIERIVKIEGAFAHVDYGEIKIDECIRIQKPIIDFHALQSCDMAVVSDSGYGKLGVWNRVDPSKDLFIFKKSKENFNFVKMDMDDLTMNSYN